MSRPDVIVLMTDQERADLVAFLQALTDASVLQDARFSDPFLSSD